MRINYSEQTKKTYSGYNSIHKEKKEKQGRDKSVLNHIQTKNLNGNNNQKHKIESFNFPLVPSDGAAGSQMT